MFQWQQIVVFGSLFYIVNCRFADHYSSNSRPAPAAILMHKQALDHDGTFNYAFAADNGMEQGESILPDGSRSGAYSYVDPNGETISVQYTAGVDGFQVYGDHIPKPAVAVIHQ